MFIKKSIFDYEEIHWDFNQILLIFFHLFISRLLNKRRGGHYPKIKILVASIIWLIFIERWIFFFFFFFLIQNDNEFDIYFRFPSQIKFFPKSKWKKKTTSGCITWQNKTLFTSPFFIYFIVQYLFFFLPSVIVKTISSFSSNTHTHTHTPHIYIIYIYIYNPRTLVSAPHNYFPPQIGLTEKNIFSQEKRQEFFFFSRRGGWGSFYLYI